MRFRDIRKWCVACYIKAILLSVSSVLIAVVSIYYISVNQFPSTLLFLFAGIIGVTVGIFMARIFNRQYEMAQKLEQDRKRLDAIHSYIGTVVHDLRSPAASINMVADFLEEELLEIPDFQKDLVATIKKSSTLMLERIGGILDNTRIEKGINVDHLTAGNPYHVLIKIIENHKILALDKGIEIENLVPEELPNTNYDPEALESVFGNLISNSIKYSPRNTTIHVFHRTEKGKLTIYVKDEGLGMTEDDLKKVFGEFAKLSARPTAGEGSSGLGLSIVKKLVEQMGGTVKAESEGRNEGSTFSFTLKTTAKIKTLTA
jgi:signal transduction histidine kinase